MKSLISTLLIILATNAFAHGENKFGPHNGYIRMPGAFHTELVPGENKTFSVFLMDVNNKQPTTMNSSVVFEYNNNERILFECKPADDHYTCNTDKKITLEKGQITLKAIREGRKGKDAVYELPLSLDVSKNAHNGHVGK
jgi:hypothetical protein